MAQQQRSFLGDQLIKLGKITEGQLEEALEQQKILVEQGRKGMLGQVLVDMGFCTQEDIAYAMAMKSGSAFFTLSNHPIDIKAMSLISHEASAKYKALAIGFDQNRLQVALMNPNDLMALDDLRILTGYEIQPVVVPDKELMNAIKKYTQDSVVDQEKESISEAKPEEDTQEDEKPAVQLANQIFNLAVEAGASDIHIEPQEVMLRVRFRIDGVLHEIMQQPSRSVATLTSRIKVLAGMNIAERRIPQDGRITLKIEGKTIDVRVASLPSAYGEKLTLRLLNRSSRLITLSELGFPETHLKSYIETIQKPYGFILITGPTGSGKSTTLYASLAKLNSVDKNIITLEDPIERRMEGLNQIQMNAKAGMSFASGLRSILRSDPDIIMVGEIRDFETAKIAVESALTGHLVLSTLHTNDAVGAVSRLGDMGVEKYLTSSALAGVVAQRLMRILCPNCKKPYVLTRDEVMKTVPDLPLEDHEHEVTLYQPRGCMLCNQTGYKGRVGIYEFMRVDETIQRMIMTDASANDLLKHAVDSGMITMRMDGLIKVKKGISSLQELLRVMI
ncbi:MAG: Flp pilus assembly complex ATPase component TadA [Thermoclostridium sp.]|nr:Flp pilus assembly complex ATPase component TadA [Thermoclostridium sp.]